MSGGPTGGQVGSPLELIGGTIVELAASLEDFLDQVVVAGALTPWYLLSEGIFSRPLAEGERLPPIPTGPQASDDIEIVLALDLDEPSQYDEIVSCLYGYREIAPHSGRFLRQRQGNKIIVELLPLYTRSSTFLEGTGVLHQRGGEYLFRKSQVVALQGRDFRGMLRAFSLHIAQLSSFVLLKAYSFLKDREPRHVIELCYALEFLRDGSLKAAAELKPNLAEPWVARGVQLLRELFESPQADAPVAYANEHGVSLPAAVRFRRQQAYSLVRRLLNRIDGLLDED